MTPIRRRFQIALILYALLGVGAWFTLEGNLRWIVLILLGVFTIRSWVALRREELE